MHFIYAFYLYETKFFDIFQKIFNKLFKIIFKFFTENQRISVCDNFQQNQNRTLHGITRFRNLEWNKRFTAYYSQNVAIYTNINQYQSKIMKPISC